MIDKVQKIREAVKKRYEYWKEKEYNSHSIESEIRMSECKHLLLMLDSLQEESVSEDLGDYINELSKQFPEVSFAKLSRIAVRVAKWQKEKEYTCYEEAFEDGAKWKVENLWKPADGDDLPILDREVIALLDNGKVVFAHRPPEYWDGKDIVTGKVTRHYPKTYDKGGWNIPDVKWWLDCSLPNMED